MGNRRIFQNHKERIQNQASLCFYRRTYRGTFFNLLCNTAGDACFRTTHRKVPFRQADPKLAGKLFLLVLRPEPTPEPTPEPKDPTVGILQKIIDFIQHIIKLITEKK